MKKLFKKYWIWIIILLVFLIFTAVPVLLFILKFQDQVISNQIKHWAEFGSFFGGVLSPIIAVFNLALVAYITWMVYKLNSKENKSFVTTERCLSEIEKHNQLQSKVHFTYQELIEIINNFKIDESSIKPLELSKEIAYIKLKISVIRAKAMAQQQHIISYENIHPILFKEVNTERGREVYGSLVDSYSDFISYMNSLITTSGMEFFNYNDISEIYADVIRAYFAYGNILAEQVKTMMEK